MGNLETMGAFTADLNKLWHFTTAWMWHKCLGVRVTMKYLQI